ncbi:MAG: DUF3341 domain-containing protein [Acidobacteria bacterium]|nr:DUF3341 domain-containing protein [Acidobacteriota bacterium]
MNRRLLVAAFEREEDILGATRACRDEGLKVIDVWTPYPVHGLDQIMGMARSRLPLVTLILAIIGGGLKIWFEYWTTEFSWPLNVGGKPWDSLPAFIPVTFEVMVLTAGISTVVAFLIATRLWPGKAPLTPDPRATDDRFVLVVEEADSTFDVARVTRLLEGYNAFDIDERVVGQGEVR